MAPFSSTLVVDEQVYSLPLTIGSAPDNLLVLSSARAAAHHAVVLASSWGPPVLLTAGLQDTLGGAPILGGLLVLSMPRASVRLAGVRLTLSRPLGWLSSQASRSACCPICKGRIAPGDPTLECAMCHVVVHDVPFCRNSLDQTCFACGATAKASG